MPVAVARITRSSDPKKTSTIRKPATTPSGRMRLRSVPKSSATPNIHRLRLCEPVRCTRKRGASGTSHLAVVNSRFAHGLQESFSAQPRAIARLARKIRSRRLDTSISLILWVTSGVPPIRLGSAPMSFWMAYQSLISNSCRAVKRGSVDPMMGKPHASFRGGAG